MINTVEDIQKQFNEIAQQYDKQRPILIPCFEDFYGIALQLSEQVPHVSAILDIGAGTGLLSSFFRMKYPEASVTLVDISSNMLAKAKKRFEGEGGLTFVEADLNSYDLGEQQFDLIVSSLAIHHLEHDLKKVVFQKAFHALKPNGWFINADQVLGNNKTAEQVYTTSWKNHVNSSGALTLMEKESAFERIKLDRMSTLEEQLEWLDEVGFTDPASYYQYMNFTVFGASKYE